MVIKIIIKLEEAFVYNRYITDYCDVLGKYLQFILSILI